MADADVTELLEASREGDAGATGELLRAVYDELRAIARSHRARHEVGDTLTATTLVHEAYIKMVDGDRLPFEGRAHFFGAAARSMRQVIVDAARARGRAKRGGGEIPIRLDDAPTLANPGRQPEILALDEALGLSNSTVKRDWAAARAWLHNALTND